jgi:hypothetical protein
MMMGPEKNPDEDLKNKKGKVEITYTEYLINKGVDDTILNKYFSVILLSKYSF